ncbi:hypothetical protein [Lysinibacillus sp. BPa_S21]|uniref:hypothetical protein n=1 Tax=Lysinibacillus sp. BPa_S21 TaxID=2932478 RepID=UPI0020118EBF|nr:hypothetical protein [Lysinibacillus sp. BPa_S21]MCL1696341.1 hypothetical protein [Lysinibacillus sp. BPa_S21]
MDKFLLDECMVEHIEYMRNQDCSSLYGIVKSIHETSNSDLFNIHSEAILKYFNDFDEKTDDDNFMKCLLGHYEIKQSPEEQIKDFYNNVIIPKTKDVDSESYVEGTIEASTVEKVLRMMGRLDIIK